MLLPLLLALPIQTPGDAFELLSSRLAVGDLAGARAVVTDDCWHHLERPCERFVGRLARARVGLGSTAVHQVGDYAAAPAFVLGRSVGLLFRKTADGWRLDDLAQDEAGRLAWVNEKPKPTWSAAPKLEALAKSLAEAFTARDAAAVQPMCTPAFWDAQSDGGQGMARQFTGKVMTLGPPFARRVSARGFAVADVLRNGQVKDRVWLLAAETKDGWRLTGITERTRFVRAYLQGVVDAPFDPEALPSDPRAAKALKALAAALEARAGKKAAKQVRDFEGRTPGIGAKNARQWLGKVATTVQAVDAPGVYWLAKTGRGLGKMRITYREDGQTFNQLTWFYLTAAGVVDLNYGRGTDWLFGLD